MFASCSSMVKSDVRIAHLPAMNDKVVDSMYSGCKCLAVDLYSLLPMNGFSVRRINMDKVFSNAHSL